MRRKVNDRRAFRKRSQLAFWRPFLKAIKLHAGEGEGLYKTHERMRPISIVSECNASRPDDTDLQSPRRLPDDSTEFGHTVRRNEDIPCIRNRAEVFRKQPRQTAQIAV